VSDISLLKTASPDPVKRGKTLIYVLTLHNSGPRFTVSATAVDPLPPEVVFLSCTGPPTDQCNGPPVGSNGTVIAEVSFLDVSDSRTFTIAVRVIAASGTIVNTATVSGTSIDPNPDNNQATVITTIEAEPTSAGVAALSPGGLALFATALIAVAIALIRRGS
jgi:uncharacterized repeat protein (TIGR01451 family)